MIDALAGCPLFAGLTPAELGPLATMAVARTYSAGTIIVSEGDRADTLYFVLSGRIKVFMSGEDGRELFLTTQGPGTYFGDMMLDDGVRSASVMTLEACRLAALSRHVFREFLLHHPETAMAVINNLIRRLRAMNLVARDLALLGVYGRVANLLLSLAQEVDGRLIVEDRLTQQEIGERIGASREMVSRIMTDLEAGGAIERERKSRRIVILRKPEQRW
jgi:CRP/FNR family cyclic AMP-dependent transcriptional regulator